MAGFSVVMLGMIGLVIMVFLMFCGIVTIGAGIGGIVFGIIRLVKANRMKQRQEWAADGVRSSGIVLTVLGSGLLLFCAALITVGVLWLNRPPEGIDTGISIVEKGFQDKQFTANGSRYTVMELDANVDYCEENSTPVYTYLNEDGLVPKLCNYNRVENDGDFDILYAEGLLFCPAEQMDAIMDYYTTPQASALALFEHSIQIKTVTDPSVYQAFRGLSDAEKVGLEYLSFNDFKEFRVIDFTLTTKDKVFELRRSLLFTGDAAYLIESKSAEIGEESTAFLGLKLENFGIALEDLL